jgi:hypothetical protein
MNVIQKNLSLVPRFVSINMLYHVWESFLGIMLSVLLTQWRAQAAQNDECLYRNR